MKFKEVIDVLTTITIETDIIDRAKDLNAIKEIIVKTHIIIGELLYGLLKEGITDWKKLPKDELDNMVQTELDKKLELMEGLDATGQV